MPVFGAFWRRKVTNFCFHTKTRWKAPLCHTTAISIDQKRFSWAIPRSRGPNGELANACARLVRGNGRSHKRPCRRLPTSLAGRQHAHYRRTHGTRPNASGHLAWLCQTSRRSAGASTRKSFSARGALRLTSRKQPDSDAARLRRGKGLVHHARLGHRSTTIFCQSWRSQPPGPCVFAEGKDLWLDGASGTAAPSSSAIVGGHNHRGRVHLPRRVGARLAACFWREKADEPSVQNGLAYVASSGKKRILSATRLMRALDPFP